MDVVRTISESAESSSPSSNDNNLSVNDAPNNATTTATSSNENGESHAVIAPEAAEEDTLHHEMASPRPLAASATATVQDDEDEVEGGVVEQDEEEEEDDYEYEYEDEDDAAYGGFLQVDHHTLPTLPTPTVSTSDEAEEASAAAKPNKIEEETTSNNTAASNLSTSSAAAAAAEKKPQWREPTREAVNMSLRAEKETSGSKRRLAQDLYRIMNKDTEETGFSLQPAEEDSMDRWTIRLFQFDNESNLAKDMMVLGLDSIELEMSFPDQYPFEPPFVRVVRPRFKRQTGFVMNGAICMELLTKDGWNPVNDIESVIVSIRSLLVVGEGRLEAAYNLTETKYKSLLEAAESLKQQAAAGGGEEAEEADDSETASKRQRKNSAGEAAATLSEKQQRVLRADKNGGKYSEADAKAAYEHLSKYHKIKGWDTSGWWARKG